MAALLSAGNLTVNRDVARTELARRLVQLSKERVRDEGTLAQGGLDHLRELTLGGGKKCVMMWQQCFVQLVVGVPALAGAVVILVQACLHF